MSDISNCVFWACIFLCEVPMLISIGLCLMEYNKGVIKNKRPYLILVKNYSTRVGKII